MYDIHYAYYAHRNWKWKPDTEGRPGDIRIQFELSAFVQVVGYAAEPVLSQLSRVVSGQGIGALEQSLGRTKSGDVNHVQSGATRGL